MKQILENWRKYTKDRTREVLSEERWASREEAAKYDQFIESASKKTGVPFALIKAIIKMESNFKPNRVHPESKAQGLMQVIPKSWTEKHQHINGEPVPKDQWLNPEINILAGAKHIANFIKHYKAVDRRLGVPFNILHAISAYNAGTVVTKWIKEKRKFPEEIPWPGNKDYVRRVIKFYNDFNTSGVPLDEEAKSKSQQRFMGMVHKCKTEGDCASAEIEKTADSMKSKDVKDFAKTKHKGLPNKVKKK